MSQNKNRGIPEDSSESTASEFGHGETSLPTQDRSRDRHDEFSVPPSIGRYVITRQLGRGGFGFVYLADDPSLNRQVAVKVPRWDRQLNENSLRRFLHEGRMLAQVNHPSVVSVYDVGTTEDDVPFVVMEYVKGRALSQIIKKEKLELEQALEFLHKAALALQVAHKHSIVHRDFKPANVIIDEQREIHLVDFGLALHDELTYGELGDRPEGTPAYMAPEQIRGENHRIDGQTDVWGFGVTMYELLTGKRPFIGPDDRELTRQICYRRPKPLRQLNEKLPKDLERICLRCLHKLMDERYQSMADVIDDLGSVINHPQRQTLAGTSGATLESLRKFGVESKARATDSSIPARSDTYGSESPASVPLNIVPKGLRPFEHADADFFLRLLPGPVDRHGVPESIRFWLARLDSERLMVDVPLGLIYGPSGCGKSSFVRAGLLPRLSSSVVPVYIDCTADDPAHQIVRKTQQSIQSIEATTDPGTMLRQIRLGHHLRDGDKLLLVLDQFEQWLAACDDIARHPLTEALRHCDPQRVQCLLLVRDDFWMSVSQFMHHLEIRIEEGKNAMSLPLFDERHARHVLEAYGRAQGDLPADPAPLSRQNYRFLKEAIKSLSQRGRVICVHLSVFAQMMKNRPWTPQQLRSIGGWEGVGREFLEDVFSGPQVPQHRRQFEGHARKILAQLLPDQSRDIKGRIQPRDMLRQAANLDDQGELFDEVMWFLEHEAHLISPIEDSGAEDSSTSTDAANKQVTFYHLTHDFLVNPVRNWLTSKQKQTWQGRTQLRFAELNNAWTARQENRFLPSLFEFVSMLWVSRSLPSDVSAKAYFRACSVYYLRRAGAVMVLVIAALAALLAWGNQIDNRHIRDRLSQLVSTSPAGVPYALESLDEYANRVLRNIDLSQAELSSSQRLRLLFALARFGPFDQARVGELLKLVPNAKNGECGNIVQALAGHHRGVRRDAIRDALLQATETASSPDIQMRFATVLLHLGDESAVESLVNPSTNPTQRTAFIHGFKDWHGELTSITQQIERSTNSSFQSAMALAIGTIDSATLSSNELKSLNTLFQSLLANCSAEVHSAARWTLSQLGWPQPRRTTVAETLDGLDIFNQTARRHANWHDLPGGITMVRIPASHQSVIEKGAGLPQQLLERETIRMRPIDVHPDFYLSDIEIPIGLFHVFVNDPQAGIDWSEFDEPWTPNEEVSPGDGWPAQRLDFRLAMLFCNWLSHKTGREPCYEKTDGIWSVHNERNGFRVPTHAELELACRAGSTTTYHFGGLELHELLRVYSCNGDNSSDGLTATTHPCGSHMPNRFGLFDTLGNVAEWCWPDGVTSLNERKKIDTANWVVYRGGTYLNQGKDLYCGFSRRNPMNTSMFSIGFRIACSIGEN